MGAEKNGTEARIRITSLESHPVDHLGTHSLLENQQKINQKKSVKSVKYSFLSLVIFEETTWPD